MRIEWMRRMQLVGWLRVRFRGGRQNIDLKSRTNAMNRFFGFFNATCLNRL